MVFTGRRGVASGDRIALRRVEGHSESLVADHHRLARHELLPGRCAAPMVGGGEGVYPSRAGQCR
jgi:hypothetical protein